MSEDAKLLRNLGLVGQGGAGKTSLGDALLYAAGVTTRLGRVDDGSSNLDFEPEEVRRKITLTTAFHRLPWRRHEITLVDMPGYANFLADTLNCMRACSGLVFVLSPMPGDMKIEAEKVWARANELELPRLGFVTRMDRENADFRAAVTELEQVLQARAAVLQLPIGAADTFRGFVDLIRMRAVLGHGEEAREEDVPQEFRAEAEAARERLLEVAAEASDAWVERYLEAGTLDEEELREALREGTRSLKFVPVLCGSSLKMTGIAALLDAVVDFLPWPAERPPAKGVDPKLQETIERVRAPESAFSGFVFKTIVDPFAGRLSVLEVISGTIGENTSVWNANREVREHVGHLFRLEGKKQQAVVQASVGSIVAMPKLRDTASGDTLADEKAPIRYPGLVEIPAAISFALEPKSKGDEEKASQALQRMMEEDLTLRVHRDPQTRELILSGVGQLHIEVVIEKLKRKYGVEVNLKTPKVP